MKTRCRLRIIQTFMVVAALALSVTPALAVHNDGVFQLDGDAFSSTCGGAFGGAGCTGDDWNNLYSCSGTVGSCTAAVPGTGNSASVISPLVFDPAPVSIFTGGGSKDEEDITQWAWVNGSVPDKDDLIEAFAALYTPSSGTRAGHKVIYAGANRFAVNGDAQIGFWFFQSSVCLASSGAHAGTFVNCVDGSPVSHVVGDVLILSNFVQGGGSSNIQVYVVTKIITSTKPKSNAACPAGSVETSGSLGAICLAQLANGTAGTNGVCNPATTNPVTGAPVPADTACAATNGAIVQSLDPNFTSKAGADTGFYPVVGFFELGLDLNAIGLQTECFASFMVETRSSQSITAVLKDFTLGGFERCFATIDTKIADSTGADVTDTSVIPGTVIHDLATVTGNISNVNPGVGGSGNCTTGTKDCKVTFTLYPITIDPTTGEPSGCSGTAIATSTSNCNSNGDGTCTATSDTFTTVQPPGYSFTASYHGDSNYAAISLPADRCEIVLVGKLDSQISTDIYQTADAFGGTTGFPKLVTDSFIDISVPTQCQAAGGTCSGTPAVCSVSPCPSGFGTCSCAPGGVTVKVRDQALVSPVSSQTGLPTPTCGSANCMTFTVFSNADCTGTTQVFTVPLGTSAPLCNGTLPPETACAESPELTQGATGLSFRVTYGGDSVYNPSAASRCEPVCAINSGIQ